MKKFKCLLFDTNVVIKLFSLGLWDAFVKQYAIHLFQYHSFHCRSLACQRPHSRFFLLHLGVCPSNSTRQDIS
jgi:hypothetical protein